MLIKPTLVTGVTSSGGVFTLDVRKPYETYYFTNSGITLSANVVITTSGTLVEGQVAVIKWLGQGINSNGNLLRAFGETIDSVLIEKDLTIVARYDGSSWDVRVSPDFGNDNFITEDKLESGVVLPRFIDKAIDYTDVQTANTTPVEILAGVTGKIIIPIAASIILKNGGSGATDYATNTIAQIATEEITKNPGDVEPIFELDCLGAAVPANPQYAFPRVDTLGTPGNFQQVINEGIYFTVKTANPTGGTNRDINIRLWYFLLG